jgi:hypothetical protein
MRRSGGRSGGRSSSSGRGGGRSGGGGGRGRGRSGGRGGGGDLVDILGRFFFLELPLLVFAVFWGYSFITDWRGGALIASITRSTIQRDPLPAGIVRETGYLRCDEGPFTGEETLVEGLRYFYQKTGVQPYLWAAQTLGRSKYASWEEIDAALEKFYNDTFTDEGHLLVLFYEPLPEDYKTAYLVGSDAEAVIDEEASDILLDYLDKYYYYENLSSGEYFAAAFRKSANRIMSVTMEPKHTAVLTGGGLALTLVLAVILARARKRRRDRELLNAPVNTTGEDAGKAENPAGPEQPEPETGKKVPERWRGYRLKKIASMLTLFFAMWFVNLVVAAFLIKVSKFHLTGFLILDLLIGSFPFFLVLAMLAGIMLTHAEGRDRWGILLFEVFCRPFLKLIRWFRWENIKPFRLLIVALVLCGIAFLLNFFFVWGDKGVKSRLASPPAVSEQAE